MGTATVEACEGWAPTAEKDFHEALFSDVDKTKRSIHVPEHRPRNATFQGRHDASASRGLLALPLDRVSLRCRPPG